MTARPSTLAGGFGEGGGGRGGGFGEGGGGEGLCREHHTRLPTWLVRQSVVLVAVLAAILVAQNQTSQHTQPDRHHFPEAWDSAAVGSAYTKE